MASDNDSIRQAALNQLKLSKNKPAIPNTITSPAARMSSPMISTDHFAKPPAQSRDASQTSRFMTPSRPIVLAPNTSPIPASPPSNAAATLQQRVAPRPPPIGHGGDPSFWSYHPPTRRDPLSATSSFVGASSYSSNGTLAGGVPYQPSGRIPQSPLSSITSPSSSSVVPDSPAVGRPIKRRKVTAADSDDESPSEASAARIVRGVRPQLMPAAPKDEEFYRWKVTYPTEPLHRLQAAWESSRRVPSEAAKLVASLSFNPPSPLSQPTTSQRAPPLTPMGSQDSDVAGHMEQRRLQRAAMRAKQEQSSIYRTTTRAIPTLAPQPIQILSPVRPIEILSSPLRPVIPAKSAAARKAKRVIVDSDDESAYDSEGSESSDPDLEEQALVYHKHQAVKWFNDSDAAILMELTGCDRPQADVIISKRPFEDADDLITKLGQGRRKAGPKGLSPNLFDDVVTVISGYTTVDDILKKCEAFGENIRRILESWTPEITKGQDNEGGLALGDVSQVQAKGFIQDQPQSLAPSVVLKDYQVIGLNWLNLMFQKKRSCILADEMGLGKTVQVISFLAYLRDQGTRGPHLIVVPSSTLENWCREFHRFAPDIPVRTYYADKAKRSELRENLKANCLGDGDERWDVLITTYTLAQGDELDRKFLKKMPWVACIFDEGHVLKNFLSQRYTSLVGIPATWKLLLTGTPLQNNFQELVSLMNFILPNMFEAAIDELRAIFKVKTDSAATLLSRERISRAKKMMIPFVLRRRKDQVLKDLPKKKERVEYCTLSDIQSTIYREAMLRSRKIVLESAPDTPETMSSNEDSGAETKKKKSKPLQKKLLSKDTSSNVLMDLRKAALHPMLFRRRFTDGDLDKMTKVLLKQPDFVKRGAVYELVKEDMEVMTDSELQRFCQTSKCLNKFVREDRCYLEAGKIDILLSLLSGYKKEGRRILIFSQFTQILDILEVVLEQKSIKYLVLTGSTPVDLRQSLVDEFNENSDIGVFLLSTRAGGMGINLTAASVVILFDQDFNPHNDKQAADRAYRIGQTRDVDVVKLITKGTIEEDMLRLAETKLALDSAVAGEDGDSRAEKIMKQSLMSQLRKQFQDEEPESSK